MECVGEYMYMWAIVRWKSGGEVDAFDVLEVVRERVPSVGNWSGFYWMVT